MDNSREIKIGATTYTVEREFSPDARETASQMIERLLLQEAKLQGQKKIPQNSLNSLDMWENRR